MTSPSWLSKFELILSATGTCLGIFVLGHLDRRTTTAFGVNIYTATHVSIAHTLMTAESLPDLGKVVTALVGASAGAIGLLRVFGSSLRTRALAAGSSTLIMGLTGSQFPAGASFAATLVDNPAFHP